MATLTQPKVGGLRSVTEHGSLFLGWTLGTFVLCMSTWIVVPTVVAGWDPMVISSGSMSPLVGVGDVILFDPSITDPGPGSVVAFDRGQGPIVHRVLEVHADGSLHTKGDANPTADSAFVESGELIGTGRLLVPFIGLIRLMPFELAVALAVFIGIAMFTWRVSPGWSAVALLTSVTVLGLGVAAAAFASSTSTGDNAISAVVVEPATDLNAACGLITLVDASIDLSWSPSPTAALTGYTVMHDPPGPQGYSEIASVPAGTTSHTHALATTPLNIGSHSYQVWARLGTWWSASAAEDSVELIEIIDGYVCLEL